MNSLPIDSQNISREAVGEFALSAGQQGLWAIYQLSPDSGTYNLSIVARLKMSLDVPAFEGALRKLVERHPALRTTFALTRGKPTQRIAAQPDIFFQRDDATTWSTAALEQRMADEVDRPFDLEHGPLLRTLLFTRAADEHILLMVTHHIISDYWSLVTLAHELGAFYESEQSGVAAPLTPLSLDYADYVRWHTGVLTGPQGGQMSTYWREQLAGQQPILNIPTDKPRPPIQTYRGGTQSCVLDAALTHQLSAFSNTHGVTLYTTLLAAFQVLLHRYTGQDDIWVGSPVAGRSQAEFSGLVGYFSNHLVLRARIAGDPSFAEFLAQTHHTVQDALINQDYPFATLVQQLHRERDFSRSPLFQASFVFLQSDLLGQKDGAALMMGASETTLKIGGLHVEALALVEQSAQTDLSLIVGDINEELVIQLRYSTDLFEADTMARMLEHLQALLQSLLADSAQPLSALSLLSDAKRQEILFAWNDTRRDYPRGQGIHEWFEAQAARTPNVVALVGKVNFSDPALGTLTYGELNQRANQLARHLQKQNVKRGDLVGICMDRSVDLVTGILAILKAGGAYLPIDPKYPPERGKLILQDAQASLLLTQQNLRQELDGFGIQLVSIDADWVLIAQQDAGNLACEAAADDLAYVIYTSGSTGKPKGVMITHANLCSHVDAIRAVMQITENDRHLHAQSFAFSASVRQIFVPLCAGASVVIATNEQIQAPIALFETMKEWGVTTWAVTPSYWRNCAQVLGSAAPEKQKLLLDNKLRLIVSASELLWSDIPENWVYGLGHGAQIINMLGQTEVTGIVSTHVVAPKRNEPLHVVPAGRPIANAHIYLLDRHMQPVPVGLPGEMYVGGEGLGRGYLNRPDLTAEKFVPNPFLTVDGRMYRTGDLARYRTDGTIEFIGRADHQIKIRGFRIEPGEVEAVLGQHPAVREAVVMAAVIEQHGAHDYQGRASEDQQLVAYVVADSSTIPTPGDLRTWMKKLLPDYMIPSAFIFLDAFPLTPTGKVNRSALPQVDASNFGLDETGYVPPRNPVEEVLVRIWTDLLSVERVGIHDNFFELGGHSLLAIQSMAYLQEMLGVEEPLIALFFEDPTVAGVANALIQSQRGQGDMEEIAATLNQIVGMSDEEVDAMLASLSDDDDDIARESNAFGAAG